MRKKMSLITKESAAADQDLQSTQEDSDPKANEMLAIETAYEAP